jgi:hypothetical protein
MPLVQTRGAASAQGFGEFAQASAVNYIEDVFSTFLYTGTGSARSINNGIDLSTKGGLVWIKNRNDTEWNDLEDTARGATNWLSSNSTSGQTTNIEHVTAFNTNGFSLGTAGQINRSAFTYASWTFRKQPKFFDIVTWTGDGADTRNIAHSLAVKPAFIIVKRTDAISDWVIDNTATGKRGFLNKQK